jgi:hypothetical protein
MLSAAAAVQDNGFEWSQLVSGLAGGFLALAGAFGVAIFNGHRSDKQHRQRLAAEFIATGDSMFTLAKHINNRSSFGPNDLGLQQLLELHQAISTVGNELALGVKRPLAQKIRQVTRIGHTVVFQAALSDFPGGEGWDNTAEEYADALVDVDDELHKLFGAGEF